MAYFTGPNIVTDELELYVDAGKHKKLPRFRELQLTDLISGG